MDAHMNTKTLTWVKRLEPFPDESLAGFVGRWARDNVCYSRLNLLTAIGVSKAIRVFPADLIGLSKSLGVDLGILESIAPSSDPVRPVLRRGHTRPSTEAVCPECLRG